MILNEQQRAAIGFDGHLSLVSCPGSGKTRTVVAKILRCVEQVRGSTRRIGCITYTNVAVNEIETRLRLYGSWDDHLYCEICTIHSFCLNHIIRPNHRLLPEFPDGFEVLAPDDARWHDLVGELVKRHNIDGRRADGFERVEREPDGTVIAPDEIGQEAAHEFLEYMDRSAFIPFSEMVYHSTRIFRLAPWVPRGLASRFAWMVVDEFQDTTVGQVRLFDAIAKHERTAFFLVGDPNQSIMSFAGGRPGLMADFSTRLSARTDIKLAGNYRCSKRIVAHAERLCKCNPPMQAVGEHRDYPVGPEYVHAASVMEAVFDHFIPALESVHIPLGEAAVLAPWWVTLLNVAKELRQRGVAMIGPGARPYRRSRDLAQFAENACAYLEEPSAVISGAAHRALFLMLLNITGKPDWRVYTYEGRKTLFRLLWLARTVANQNEGAADWLTEVATAFTTRLIEDDFLPLEKGDTLTNSAASMIEDMRKYKVDVPNLRLPDLGIFARPSQCLNMLTLHGSKGREFDAVAIVDLHDGKVPDFRSKDDPEKVAEARRLLYVGVTRARKLLMYFTDSSHWKNEPTPFLGEGFLNLIPPQR